MIKAITLSLPIFLIFIMSIFLIFHKKQLEIKTSTLIGLILIIIIFFINTLILLPWYYFFTSLIIAIAGDAYTTPKLFSIILESLAASLPYCIGWLTWLFSYKKNSLWLLLIIFVMNFIQCFVFSYCSII